MEIPRILTSRIGGMPGWAWGGLGIGAALAVATWRGRETGGSGVTQAYEMPETLQPTYVFQSYDQDRISVETPSWVPPGGGRGDPVPWPVPRVPVPRRTPPPDRAPMPPPTRTQPRPPDGRWVVAPPVRDPLQRIAHLVYGSAGQWQKIWAAGQNARLRDMRADAGAVRPGDRVWVPA